MKSNNVYFVDKPLRKVTAPGIPLVKGRTYPTLTYMCGDL